VLADANVTPTSSNELAAKHTNADISNVVQRIWQSLLGFSLAVLGIQRVTCWQRLPSRLKLLIGFLAVFGLMGSALAGVLLAMRAQSDVTTLLTRHLEPARVSAWKLRNYVRRADAHGAYVIMAQAGKDHEEHEDNVRDYNDDLKRVSEVIAESKALADTDAQRAALAQIGHLWSGPNGFLAENARAFELSRAGKVHQALRKYIAPPSIDSVIEMTAKYIAECDRLAAAAVDRQISLQRRAMTAGIGVGLVALLLGLSLMHSLARAMAARQRAERHLGHAAFHDPLTDLPNRALFVERLRSALAQGDLHPEQIRALLFLDVDRFKLVNDTLGHHIGDQLLIAIARRLEGCLRASDTLARLGGDEFTVLLEVGLPDAAATAAAVAERMLQAFAAPFTLGGHEVYVTVTIGIALSSTGTSEDLLRDADIAMYRAKSLGKHRYEFFESGDREAPTRLLQLESGLRRAADRSEFTIAYQPIISLTDGRLTGFEALARWEHPELGPISPEEFIPVAEETGLICPLGEWILREACAQTRRWQEAFPAHAALCVSVNVSVKQLQDERFVDRVRATLAQSGLSAECLRVEITESHLMSNPVHAAAALHKLRALGAKIYLDDFGTGYSSLAYLHQFPVDALKIDRSFVSNGESDEIANPEIVKAVIALAHHLGFAVIAEGIETEEQERQLRTLRCNYAQGYRYARPLDVHAAERYLIKAQVARQFAGFRPRRALDPALLDPSAGRRQCDGP
jgi:diguanylate cyclase (GGDEF)-like protein